jgi:hypothetical protein
MNKSLIKWPVTTFILLVLSTLVRHRAIPVSGLQLGTFDSPVVTPVVPNPTPTPWPTISPDLPSVERALQFVAQRQGIPQKWLNRRQNPYAIAPPQRPAA